MNRRIKVIHVITSLNIGGTEKLLYNLILSQKNNYDVSVIYLKSFGVVGELIQKLGVKITPCRGLFSLIKLIAMLKQIKPDIIHAHLFRACIFSRIAFFLSGVRSVLITVQQSNEYFGNPFLVALSAFTLKCTDYVIANSRVVKKLIIEREHYPSQKVGVVYNGIERAAYQNAHPIHKELRCKAGDIIIGYVGRFHEEKGVFLLPKIIDAIKQKHKNFCFLLVGGGPAEDKLRKCINQLGLDDCVIFAGWRLDMPNIFQTIDICLLPSLRESIPQVILEAFVCGKPVVAADVGGVSEIVRDGVNGYLVPKGDCGIFADRISNLLNSSDLRSGLGESGKQTAKDFDLSLMFSSIDAIYKKTLKEKFENSGYGTNNGSHLS